MTVCMVALTNVVMEAWDRFCIQRARTGAPTDQAHRP